MSMLSGAPLILNLFGVLLLLCMAPVWLAARGDARMIRGVSVWAKPLKFLAALALFACTTAVLMQAAGGAPAAATWRIAALVIATSTFEAAYITVQAGRGEPSHYNTRDALHAALTAMMALGAIGLSASQAWLAWVIVQHNPDWLASVAVLGVVTGAVATCVLATLSGFLLGGHRAPPGPGLPLVGWRRRGDLRPAHFMGVHAQQILPACGLLAARLPASVAHAGFAALACAYVIAWAALTYKELQRRLAPKATLPI